MKNKINEQLFNMIVETNKKIRNAMYCGNNESFRIESKNFDTQYSEVIKRGLVEEYREYVKKVA